MKTRVLLSALVICLLLSGCQNDTGNTEILDFTAEDEVQKAYADNRYRMVTAMSFQEAENYFCGSSLTGNYLYYFDKACGISGVLCADPACTHDTSQCNAYIESGATLSYCGGKLFWIATDPNSTTMDAYLWESDQSGINRKKIMRLSYEDILFPLQPQQYVIHRGRLYILGQTGVVQDGKSGQRITLLCAPLGDGNAFETLADEVFYKGVTPTLRFAGDHAYLALVLFPPEGPYDVTITRYHCQTGMAETVFREAEMVQKPGAVWVTQKGDLYLPTADEGNAVVWKLEGEKRTEVAAWTGHGLSTPKIMDGIAILTRRDNGSRTVSIKSLSGEDIYEGKLFPEKIAGLNANPNELGLMFVGGDRGKLIVNLMQTGGTEILDYTLMLDIPDNLKATILWDSRK